MAPGHSCTPWTEHYSAVLAEVPDDEDPDTQLNQALIDRLDTADTILIAGVLPALRDRSKRKGQRAFSATAYAGLRVAGR